MIASIKKVGIIAFAHHNEVLLAYATIFLSSKDISLDIYCSEWIYKQCYKLHNQTSISWFIKTQDEVSNHYLLSQKPRIDGLDLLIINSYEDEENKLINTSFSTVKKLLVCHKIHSFFNPYLSLFAKGFTIKNLLHFIKYRFYKWPQILNQLKTVDGIIVGSQEVANYYQGLAKKAVKLKVYSLPFAVNQDVTSSKTSSLTIVIPGTISNKSRDYPLVLSAINGINLTISVKLIFLGKPSGIDGRTLAKRISQYSNRNIEISQYDTFIDESEYDSILQQASFLILPMHRYMSFGAISEKNGQSCISGNISDMVRYATPALVPDFYPIDSPLSTLCSEYSNAHELRSQIENWVNDEKFIKKHTFRKDAIVKHEAPFLLHSFIYQLSKNPL